MLQEITVNDLQNVRSNTKKENILVVYEYLRNKKYVNRDKDGNVIEECDDYFFKDYMFDDNISWGIYSGSKAKSAWSKYKVYYIPGTTTIATGIKIDELTYLKDRVATLFQAQYGKRYGWASNLKQLNNYIDIIFDKIVPTEEIKESLDEKVENWLKELEEKKKQKLKEESQLEEEKKENNKVEEKPKNIPQSDSRKKDAYLYKIYIDNELAYIGKTYRPIQERLQEHFTCMLDPGISNSQQQYLYKAMRECKIGYRFEIIYEEHNAITNHALECMEKMLIEELKPKYNYEGVKVPYRFSEEK